MPDLVEYQPPEGLHAHEVPFLFDSQEKIWLPRTLTTAFLELAESGVLSYSQADQRLVCRIPADRTLIPLHKKIADMVSDGHAGPNERVWRELVKARLAGQGWVDAASGRLTPAGEMVKRQITGYRDYLQRTMTDRAHVAAVEGRIDRDVEFAYAFDLMNGTNAYRALATRLGLPLTGLTASFFSFFGGQPSEQHATSYRSNRSARFFKIMNWFWALLLLGIFVYAFTHRQSFQFKITF